MIEWIEGGYAFLWVVLEQLADEVFGEVTNLVPLRFIKCVVSL